jgi:hypothetical protein
VAGWLAPLAAGIAYNVIVCRRGGVAMCAAAREHPVQAVVLYALLGVHVFARRHGAQSA